jgi:hypothetical protein
MQLMRTSFVTNVEKFLQVDGRLEVMHQGYIQERVMLIERRFRGEMKESLNVDYSRLPKIDTDKYMEQGLQ